MSDVLLLVGLVSLVVAAYLVALPLGLATFGIGLVLLAWATREKS